MVSSRAAIHPHGPGYGVAPLVRQSAHRVRRSTEPATRARGGRESHEKKYTAKFRGPVQRHTAQHIVDILPYVQILDVLVPQMGGQLVEFMQNLDTSIFDEQVIAVPKIFLDRIPQRSSLRRTQKAEQLVEVPTDPAYSLGALISSALGGGLQGSLPEQDSLRLRRAVEQIMDIPVPLGRDRSLPLIFLGTTSGMPSLLSVQSTSSKQQLHLVPAGPSRKTGSRPVWSKHQFFIEGVRGTQSQVVRRGSHVALGLVAGVMGMDVYAMVGGIVDHSLSLDSLGITSNCTVSFFSRLRGGSRENVPGQWTCSKCLAERCWPVRTKCYLCGAPRHADSAPWNDKKGKVPKAPWVVLLRKDPVLCRPRPALGRMLCRLVVPRLEPV